MLCAVAERHEEVGAALAEAAGAAKTHAAAAADWRAAALKLRHAHQLRERAAAADPPRQKKLKALDKELDKVSDWAGGSLARSLGDTHVYLLDCCTAENAAQRGASARPASSRRLRAELGGRQRHAAAVLP